MSGSSITGAIQKLLELGISREKVVVFPSWIPDGSSFKSGTAQKLWPQFRKYAGSFEKQWIKSKKLQAGFGKDTKYDFSAGMWRRELFKDESEYPGVHRHHERRKYLLTDNCAHNKYSLAKFTGLGRYGHETAEKGYSLARAGFTPAIEGLSNGFTVMDFVDGKPLRRGETDDALIEFMASYCAYVQKNFKASLTVPWEMMLEMIAENTEEGLGSQWCRHLDPVWKVSRFLYEDDVVAIDGRMMPHEWIRTASGYIKTDHIEHHADQFFHGCQNIAWDIAGCVVEFGMDNDCRNKLINRYCELAEDPFLPQRLPFFTVAYLAYRLGYVSLAAESLPGEPDSVRFAKQKRMYRELLQIQLKSM